MTKEREGLIAALERFRPWNEQEQRDREVLLDRLRVDEEVFLRTDLTAHMTASAWITDAGRSQVLMAYHNLYDSWAWLGGHADGQENLLQVALREAEEESGIRARPVSEEPFSLEVLPVEGHVKKGLWVPSHLHLNVTYLLEADPGQEIRVKPDENSRVGWFTPEEAVMASTEKWFREHIYSKLNEKMRALG